MKILTAEPTMGDTIICNFKGQDVSGMVTRAYKVGGEWLCDLILYPPLQTPQHWGSAQWSLERPRISGGVCCWAKVQLVF